MKQHVQTFNDFVNESKLNEKKDLEYFKDKAEDAHFYLAGLLTDTGKWNDIRFSYNNSGPPDVDDIHTEILDNDEIDKKLKKKIEKAMDKMESANDDFASAIQKLIPDNWENEDGMDKDTISWSFDNAGTYLEDIPYMEDF
jgi:hypothetical protein